MRAAAQRKFLDLGGSAENQGDLKSVVLHKMTLGAQKSTFPVALGVRITGVDDKAFSQTGESYSMITMPNADSHQDRVLQEDNTELAYECSLRRLEPHAAPRQPRLTVCSLYHWQSRASFPGTPPRVRAALKPHATHRTRSTHTPTLPVRRPRHQGHPRGAPSRARPRRPRPALLTRRSLARRSPPAASALSPPTIP